ncbi:MAG: GntR family transcriptional regulator [Planctomycetota bacterium]
MSQGLRTVVYDYLSEKLLTGELHAGKRVCELTVAKATGVSRSPVREAIGQLRAEGVLEQIPGYGAFVKSPTRRELDEAFQVREWLECEAVFALASMPERPELTEARSACDAMLEMLKGSHEGTDAVLSESAYDQLEQIDRTFHTALLRAAGNRRVTKVIHDTRLLIHATQCRPRPLTTEHLSKIFADHDLVLRSVQRGAPEEAREQMLGHIRWAHAETLRVYDVLAKQAEEDELPTNVAKRHVNRNPVGRSSLK